MVAYNYLNLPKTVTFGGDDKIRYIYDAAGVKHLKAVVGSTASNAKTVHYSGPFIYEDNDLKCIYTSAGRLTPITINGSVLYMFEYNLTDHLGNVRVTFGGHSNGGPEVLQVTDYYSFGLVMAQQNFVSAENSMPNKYLYNGKELQDDVLSGTALDWYDYGARMCDPTIGRWHSVDPLAEKYYSLSSYTYAANIPILFTDPDGRQIDISALMKSKDHANAFIIFSKTKEGIAFLNNYASKGQKLEYNGKVFYEANERGKFDKTGVDLNYKIASDERTSAATPEISNGCAINIEIAKEGFGSDNKTFNLVKSISHESFLHAYNQARDIVDGKYDHSSIPKEYRQYNDHADHYYVSLGYLDNPNNANVSLFLVCCKEETYEAIILTTGFSENPDAPRIGIEVRNSELYFCKENMEKKGEYYFYFSKLEPSLFLKFKNQIEKSFINVNQNNKIVDATLYELIFRFKSKTDTLRFYRYFLTKEQNEVIERLIALKNYKLQKVNYHKFPEGLLKYKLPNPPDIPKNKLKGRI